MIRQMMKLATLMVSIVIFGESAEARGREQRGISEDASPALVFPHIEDSWTYWWSYSAFSGPSFWGQLGDPNWFLCHKGRRQSPIDIRTSSLVYDPHLVPLRADNNLISGFLYNDGHAIIFNASSSILEMAAAQAAKMGSDTLNEINTKGISQSSETLGGGGNGSTYQRLLLLNENENNNNINNEPTSLNLGIGSLNSEKLNLDDPYMISSLNGTLTLADVILSSQDEFKKSHDSSFSISHPESHQADQSLNEISSLPESILNPSFIKFNGAGLIYNYKFEALFIRFDTKSESGSEHKINGRSFSAEIQLIAFNSDLYRTYYEASMKPFGLVAISVLVDNESRVFKSASNSNNKQETNINREERQQQDQLSNLLDKLDKVRHRGDSVQISDFNVSALLPDTRYFVTYDGSLTIPGCHESVIWLILNKPMYISQVHLDNLRSISADDQISPGASGKLIAGNIRPIQALNDRPIRTNIRPSLDSDSPESCKQNWRYEYRIL